MTHKPANSRKKTALALMYLAPLFAVSPMIIAMIGVRIIPECAVVPNCAAGALAYFIVLTVPIGCLVFIAGLIILLAAKRPKGPNIK
jgi:hypothetical protein